LAGKTLSPNGDKWNLAPWLDEGDGDTDIYLSIDEGTDTPNDSDYIHDDDNDSNYQADLTDAEVGATTSTITLYLRAKKETTAGKSRSLITKLVVDGIDEVILSWSNAELESGWITKNGSASGYWTESQINGAYIDITSFSSGGGGPRQVQISAAQVNTVYEFISIIEKTISSNAILSGTESKEILSDAYLKGDTRYFHKETTNGIDSYEDLFRDSVHEDLKTKTQYRGGAAEFHDKLADFITNPLASQTIPVGTWIGYLWCYADNNGSAGVTIYYKVYHRYNSTEDLLCTSSEVTIQESVSQNEVQASFPETTISTGDRIKIEVWGHYFGLSAPDSSDYYFYCDTSARDSRLDTTYLTESVGAVTKTFTSDAILSGTNSKEIISDVLLKESKTKTNLVDAYLSKQYTKTMESDSLLKGTTTKTLIIDAMLKKELTKTSTIDSLLKVTSIKDILSDGLVKTIITKEITSDIILSGTVTKSVTSDAILLKTKGIER